MAGLWDGTVVRQARTYLENFKWEVNVTPVSSLWTMFSLIAGYQVVIRVLRAVIKKPVHVPTIFPASHNLLLSVASLVMMLGCLYESVLETQRQGSYRWLYCLEMGTPIKGPMYFWSYLYYLSKYWEFVDTIFLVLKAKEVGFLHFMHHTVVAPMAWLWLSQGQSMQQIGLIFNCAVHVVMYFYYFLCTLKIYPKWKQLITVGQIVQFSYSFVCLALFCKFHYGPPHPGANCSGIKAVGFNFIFNMVLLYLFVRFHAQTYKKKPASKQS